MHRKHTSVYDLKISESYQLYEILKNLNSKIKNSQTATADDLELLLEINSSKPLCSNGKTSLLWINEVIKKLTSKMSLRNPVFFLLSFTSYKKRNRRSKY